MLPVMTLGVKKRQLLGERSRLLSSGSWVAEQAAGDLLGPVVVEEGGRRVVHEVPIPIPIPMHQRAQNRQFDP
jgi:hypothetical protein